MYLGLSAHVDAASAKANQMEKRIKQFDKIIDDWKRKADGLSQELDGSQKECRNVSSELFRVRSGFEEASIQLADVKRENATLCDEIKVELVSKELNHLAAILHVHAGGLIFMKKKKYFIIFQKGKGNTFIFLITFMMKSLQKEPNCTNLIL